MVHPLLLFFFSLFLCATLTPAAPLDLSESLSLVEPHGGTSVCKLGRIPVPYTTPPTVSVNCLTEYS